MHKYTTHQNCANALVQGPEMPQTNMKQSRRDHTGNAKVNNRFLTLITAALLLSATTACPSNADTIFYDSAGRLTARADTNGRHYDAQGRYTGRSETSGRTYDASGRATGRTDADGRSYDSSGRYVGRRDEQGRSYDASGKYIGREDRNGRRYDSTGRYTGKAVTK